MFKFTGRRFIEGYSNDFAQYKALMNSGVKYAEQFNLKVGIGLTVEDQDGNGNRNFTPNQEKWADRFSVAAVPAVTPTTVPHALPLEVRFLLFGVK